MALFAKKTCEDFLINIRRYLQIISISNVAIEDRQEFIKNAQQFAARAKKLLKNVSSLDPNAARTVNKYLDLLEVSPAYKDVKKYAGIALEFLVPLETACEQKLAKRAHLKKTVRGKGNVYLRFMTKEEYGKAVTNKSLEAPSGKGLRAYLTTEAIQTFFLGIKSKALRDIMSLMAVSGADYAVFFTARAEPVRMGSTKISGRILTEVKFPNGTPIEIIQVRRT